MIRLHRSHRSHRLRHGAARRGRCIGRVVRFRRSAPHRAAARRCERRQAESGGVQRVSWRERHFAGVDVSESRRSARGISLLAARRVQARGAAGVADDLAGRQPRRRDAARSRRVVRIVAAGVACERGGALGRLRARRRAVSRRRSCDGHPAVPGLSWRRRRRPSHGRRTMRATARIRCCAASTPTTSRSGSRIFATASTCRSSSDRIMTPVARTLDDDAIKAVAAWIESGP